MDFLVPMGDRKLVLLEVKASRTVMPEMAQPLQRLGKVISRYRAKSFLIYRPSKGEATFSAVRPGIRALSLKGLLSTIADLYEGKIPF